MTQLDQNGKQDTVTGLLLAGVGHTDAQQKKNFFIADASKRFSQLKEEQRH